MTAATRTKVFAVVMTTDDETYTYEVSLVWVKFPGSFAYWLHLLRHNLGNDCVSDRDVRSITIRTERITTETIKEERFEK